jgi:DNA-binding GntR family transcriptional regulator
MDMAGTLMSQPLAVSKTISMQVAKELRQRILDGRYTEGTKLRQEKIAMELGVSRSPVREAMGQLVAEGLVTLTPQKGAHVAAIHFREIAELFELRALIEPHLLDLAVPNLTSDDLSRAHQVVAEMKTISLDGWSDANWRFHEILYSPARRPTSMAMLKRMHHTIGWYLRLQLSATDGRAVASQEHSMLLVACQKGDIDGAVILLRRHIVSAGKLLERLNSQTNQSRESKVRHIASAPPIPADPQDSAGETFSAEDLGPLIEQQI